MGGRLGFDQSEGVIIMANIKINKGFISHNGRLYKAGEIVPIADAEYARRIVARSGNDFEFYHGEDIPDGSGIEMPAAGDGAEMGTADGGADGTSDLDNGGELPAVDADASVRKARSARR